MEEGILIVDDEAILTMHLEERLKAMGYPVAGTANSGQEAVDQHFRLRPEMVLMDIVMPDGMDGIEAAARIRSESDVPIIFVTAYADDRMIDRAKQTLPSGYILKPFQDKELKAAIEIARHKRRAAPLADKPPVSASTVRDDKVKHEIKDLADGMKKRFELLEPHLDERLRRLYAAAEALSIGPRNASSVGAATGVSRRAIAVGMRELKASEPMMGRIRKPGGGRKRAVEKDPLLLQSLENLLSPRDGGRGPLRWTCKSLRHLSGELKRKGHETSHRMMADLLHELGYELTGVNKTIAGGIRSDYDRQFEFLHRALGENIRRGEPAACVSIRSRRLSGEIKDERGETVWSVEKTLDRLEKNCPSDLFRADQFNAWTSAPSSEETIKASIQALERWRDRARENRGPAWSAFSIVIAWEESSERLYQKLKEALQVFSDGAASRINVHFLPPGTRKWAIASPVSMALLAEASPNRSILASEIILNEIRLEDSPLEQSHPARPEDKGDPISSKAMESADKVRSATLNIKPHELFGKWNFTVFPRNQPAKF